MHLKFVPSLPLLLAALGCLASSAAAAGEKPAKSAAPDPGKPYVLFMGVDLAVQREKDFHRVEDVRGGELKIRVGQRELFVPTRNRTVNLRVDNSLKLTHGSVMLAELHSGPGYTPANDPRLQFDREAGAAGGAAAVQDLAYGRMVQKSLDMAMSGQGAAGQGGLGTAAALDEAQYQEAMKAADAASLMARSAQYNTAASADRMHGKLAEENHDALEASFKISSPVELDDPHMVVLFRFQAPEAKPGDIGMLIHAESLEPIGSKPKYIRIRESGVPRGFKFIDCEVHIYNRGEEVATNASTKRIDLSRDEAQQYLVIEQISANKGATVPAAVVAGSLPLAQRTRLSSDQLNRRFYAQVSAEGTLLGAYVDADCREKLEDAATLAAVKEVFFKPALNQGKPVAGVVRVQLGEI